MRSIVTIVAGLLLTVFPAIGQISKTLLDGSVPPAIAPGNADGSWSLSQIESINLYSGLLSVNIPILGIGGRGDVNVPLTIPVSSQWIVRTTQTYPGGPVIPYPNLSLPAVSEVGYGMAKMERRNSVEEAWCVSDQGAGNNVYSTNVLTRLYLTYVDGRTKEFVDVNSDGAVKPSQQCINGSVYNLSAYDRGTTFVSNDGSTSTFVSDTAVVDQIAAGASVVTGTLYEKDGTRYRIQSGRVMWVTDRNGNLVSFDYSSTYLPPSTIHDALGREITIEYALGSSHPSEDRIIYSGYGGPSSSATRTIYVRYGAIGDHLVSGDVLTAVKDLFVNANYPSDPNVNSFLNNPSLPYEVELADGTKFTFKYNKYGELGEMTLPTGATVAYSWGGYPAGTDGMGVNLISRRVQSRTITDSNGVVLGKKIYTPSTGSSYFLVRESDHDAGGVEKRRTEHQFRGNPLSAESMAAISYPGWLEGKEYTVTTKIPGFQTLKTVVTEWQQRSATNTSTAPPDTTKPNDPRVVRISTQIGSVTSKRTFAYSIDRHNNVTKECDYDFGASSATRCIDRLYKTEAAYINPPVHLRGLVTSETLTRYSPTTLQESSTAYEYDNYSQVALADCPNIAGFDPARTATTFTTRGNVTAETRTWTGGAGPAVTKVAYDIAGNAKSVTTPDVQTASGLVAPSTVFSYDDAFLDASGKNTYAFLTSVTNALGQTSTRTYHWNAARLLSSIDLNGNTTTRYYDDPLDRLTAADLPIGRTEFVYNPVSRTITTKRKLNSSGNWLIEALQYDGLGRTTQMTDAANVVHLQQYDVLGRRYKVWNPGEPSTSAKATVTTFDVIDRPLTVTYPDGAVEKMCYTNNEVVSIDAANHFKKTIYDGLGRITSVIEDPTVTTACQSVTNSSGLNYTTTYTYTGRDELLKVDQSSQTRSFDYDSLGRVVSARNPESGTISYAYDAAGNLTSRVMGGVTLTQRYDVLGRLVSKAYSDGTTPDVNYCYDGTTSGTGCSTAPTGSGKNLVGQMTMVKNSVATVKYADYDALGRVLGHEVSFSTGSPYTFAYEYNYLGMTKETYPGGRSVGYGYDAAGRVNAVTGEYNSAPVTNYVTGISYAPAGSFSQVSLGALKTQSYCYNDRLQLTEIKVASSGDSNCASTGAPELLLGLKYGTQNNGNVTGQTIQAGSSLVGTQTYGYDALNRLKTASEVKADGTTVAWARAYVYDRFGNRALVGTSTPAPISGVPQVSIDSEGEVTALLKTFSDPVSGVTVVKNQWSTSTVDAAGNVQAFATGVYPNNLSYDGESRLVGATTSANGAMSAEYDGEGHRVKRIINGTETTYLYDALGRLVQEYGGAPEVASRREYLVADHLGSTRLTLDSVGAVQSRHDYLPFGQELEVGVGDRTTLAGYQSKVVADANSIRRRFTGKERDAETGLDYFGARYFLGGQGRFVTPDEWHGGIADAFTGQDIEQPGPLPYADIADPQTLNKYAYVRNNPLRYTDPNGHCFWDACVLEAAVTWTTATFVAAGAMYYAQKTGEAIGNYIAEQRQVRSRNAPLLTEATDRGRANESKGLEVVGAKRNTRPSTAVDPKTKKETTVIPDGKMGDGQVVEVKDTKRVTDSKQLRAENAISVANSGKPVVIVTGENTKVSKTVQRNYKVVRTRELGPQGNE